MAGPRRIECRSGAPRRAWSNLLRYAAVAAVVVVANWVVFGGEPRRLDTGGYNLLAMIPPGLTVLALVLAVPYLLPLLRRPVVAADHYALLVRPGVGRTLALPWSRVGEVAAARVGREEYLLIRCRSAVGSDRSGDWPTHRDQGVLRRLPRERAAGYDLAVPLTDFVGGARSLMALAAFAPDHVLFAGKLDWA